MEGFTIIDAVVAGVILISAILAFARGLVRESLSILGWVAAAVVAFVFAPSVEPLMREVPVLGDILADSCELSLIAAFAAIFAVALVIVSIFTPIFANAVQRSAIGSLDQGLGFLFGVLRGALLVAVALVVYDRVMIGDSGIAMVDDSRSAVIFASVKNEIEARIPDTAPEWIVARYADLTRNCVPAGE